MKHLLLAELLLVLVTIIFVSLNPISRIYIADYLEEISLFLFRTLSDEDLNKYYEKKALFLKRLNIGVSSKRFT